jgi:alkyl hydroperoxide reductase subunit AhpC
MILHPISALKPLRGTLSSMIVGDGDHSVFAPERFPPVCTAELGMAGLEPEFKKRNCKIIGLSVIR